MITIPIVGSILEASGMIIEKRILREKTLNFKNYTLLSFLAIVIVMAPFLYFFWSISPQAYTFKNIFIMILIIITSGIANLLIFYSLKRENLTELEPIRLMQPLFTVILAFLFYTSERKISVLILALIASIALIATHIKKHHLMMDKYLIAALIGSFFFALELVASKSILEYYSSMTFYFIRCLGVFIIIFLVFRPKIKKISHIHKILILLASAIWVVYRIVLYYGYVTYGVVFTTVLFILAPVFIFLFAKIFLKEKITLRNIISTVIIVVCVVVAILLQT